MRLMAQGFSQRPGIDYEKMLLLCMQLYSDFWLAW